MDQQEREAFWRACACNDHAWYGVTQNKLLWRCCTDQRLVPWDRLG
jgi:hypothetical protein